METSDKGRNALQNVEDKTKKDFLKEISSRISNLIKDKHISQKALVGMCQNAGFDISQPEVSRLINGKNMITLYQAIAFSKVLNVPLEKLIEKTIEQPTVQLKVSGNKFLTDPSSAKEFSSLLGKYYVAFHSTASDEDKILEGELVFTESSSERICLAFFKLDTGDRDVSGNALYKKYQGQLLIAQSVDTAYCLLASEQIGEICMIEFRYRNFQVRKLDCRLGLVITVSAGDLKQPSVHKLFFSRTPMNGKKKNTIIQMLRLDAGKFLVSQQTLLNIKEEYPRFSSVCQELLSRSFKEYVEVNESLIEININLNRKEMIEFMSLVREREELPYTIALRAKEDQFSYYFHNLVDSKD